jgi:hypothetical protein
MTDNFEKFFPMEETVIILKSDYELLVRDSRLLQCLDQAGIDNTDAYSFGLETFFIRYPEYDK